MTRADSRPRCRHGGRSRICQLVGAEAPDLKSDVAEQDAGRPLEVVSEYKPAGDQPQAIAELVQGLNDREWDQVLLGVTGSARPSPWPM